MNSRHPDPWRVLGRCRAAVRGQDPEDPLDPGIGSFFRVFGVNNNENENRKPLGENRPRGENWYLFEPPPGRAFR